MRCIVIFITDLFGKTVIDNPINKSSWVQLKPSQNGAMNILKIDLHFRIDNILSKRKTIQLKILQLQHLKRGLYKIKRSKFSKPFIIEIKCHS
jgi:hypothetical protein